MRTKSIPAALTAVVIFCACGVAVFWGWEATRFGVARLPTLTTKPAVVDMRAWIGFPGLTAAALDTSLQNPNAEPPAMHLAHLRQLVAVTPMSARAWLLLAGQEFDLGYPAAEVDSALAMSWLVGPNEGSVMWQRGMFGVLRWEVLAPDARRHTIDDIATALIDKAATDEAMSVAKNILGRKAEQARKAIADGLRGAGVPTDQLIAIGLQNQNA